MKITAGRKELWVYVNRKIKRLIHHYHVFAVISVLFEEMLKDLVDGKEIKIINFGTFVLKQMPPKKYHDVRFNKIMETKGYKILRFFLAKPIGKKLCAAVDLDGGSGNA